MAIVLLEEVLVGLDEVKTLLEQAVTLLEDITEEMRPDMVENLKDVLAGMFLRPLQTRVAALDELLNGLATMA